MSEAERLMADFNFYWCLTANIEFRRRSHPYFRTMKATPERLALLSKMVDWCRERGMDPRLWLYMLFRVRAWQYPPRLLPGHLMSERLVPRYSKLEGLDAYRGRLREEADRGRTYDPNRDINTTVEARKRYYVSTGQTSRCMREMVGETFGYHPRSVVCSGCPAQVDCRQRLEAYCDFDVMALREGRLTAEQAMAEVRRAQQR